MADPADVIEAGAPDPDFEPAERLYLRIPLADIEGGEVSDMSIRSPAFSVDREKYRSNPRDMLAGRPGYGIGAFRVGDIPESVESDDGRLYHFGVEHRPEPGNYAHSEIHTYLDGIRLQDLNTKKPANSAKKRFRDLLRQKIEIIVR